MKDLKLKVIKGIGWRTSVDVLEQILLVVFTAVLARLLTRADFGLVALGMIVQRFIISFTVLGLGTAVIQNQDLNDRQISAIFLYNLGMSLVIYGLLYVIAPFAADFFSEPRVVVVTRLLGLSIIIQTFNFPMLLLQKNLRVAEISLAHIASMVIANVVGIGAAVAGFGYWALIARVLVDRSLYASSAWVIKGWRPTLPQFQGTRVAFNFGLNMLGSKCLTYISQNVVGIIIGKVLGVETLGAYNIAYNLAIVPAQRIKNILGFVLISAFSSIQNNIEAFRRNIRSTLFVVGLFFIPAMLGLSAVSHDLVLVVYGEKWIQVAGMLMVLAIVGLLKGYSHLLDVVILSKGWAGRSMLTNAVDAVLVMSLTYVGYTLYEVYGLLFGFLISSLASLVARVYYMEKATESKRDFFSVNAKIVAAGATMWGLVVAVRELLDIVPLVNLSVQMVSGVIVYGVIMVAVMNKAERDIIRSLPVLNKLPFL